MRDDPITRLAAANPVPHDGPTRAPEARGHGRRRRRLTLGVVVAAGAIAVVLAATPAWALVRDVLPFWDQPSAPASLIHFLSEDDGPDGPQPDLANVREVLQADLGGLTYTLYVSPTKNPAYLGYCAYWSTNGSPGFGECPNAKQDHPLVMDALPDLVHPHDASQLPTHDGWPVPPSGIHHLAEHTVVDFFMGEAWSPTARVVVHFSDGTTAQPEITWVSAPIDTGFWAYQVPNDKQSETDYVTEVDAYDANGKLLEQVPITAPTASATTGQ